MEVKCMAQGPEYRSYDFISISQKSAGCPCPQEIWLNLVHIPIPWSVRVQTPSFHFGRFSPVIFPETSFLLGCDILLGINP